MLVTIWIFTRFNFYYKNQQTMTLATKQESQNKWALKAYNPTCFPHPRFIVFLFFVILLSITIYLRYSPEKQGFYKNLLKIFIALNKKKLYCGNILKIKRTCFFCFFIKAKD